MVKLAYDPNMKRPKGPCVIVIHANWCGFCKKLMPKFENEIVTSQDFSKELEGLLTLGSIEETEYNDHPKKNIFGNIDGYPIVRYIHFSQDGNPTRSFDLPPTTPRDPEDIIAWINDAVKNDVVKNGVVKNDKKHRKSKKQHRGGKKKKCRTMRKKYKYDKYGKKSKKQIKGKLKIL